MSYLVRISIVATLGGLLFGYDTAVISGTVDFLQQHFALSELALGWVVSSAIVGCMIGAAMAGMICDRFGRRSALFVAAGSFLVSAVGTALPSTVTQLVMFRLIGGVGVGIAAIASPMYIAEIAPEHIRGRLVSLNQIAILTGMVLVYTVNSGIAHSNDLAWNVDYGWRWMFGSAAIPSLAFLGLLFSIPESPRWLIKSGLESRARSVLRLIHREVDAERILGDIKTATHHEQGGWREVFGPVYRPALVVGVILAVIQHGTGINAVMYYAPRIFSHAGVENNAAISHMVIISLVMVAFTAIGLALVDRLGRRPLLLVSTAGMAISLFALFFKYSRADGGKFDESSVLFWILGYVSAFSVAMGPIVWVLISEIFPNRVRGRCAGIAVFCMWSASLAISQFFPWLLTRLDHGVFLIFAILCVLSLIFIAIFVPETKGRTLEEIERIWHDKAARRAGTASVSPDHAA